MMAMMLIIISVLVIGKSFFRLSGSIIMSYLTIVIMIRFISWGFSIIVITVFVAFTILGTTVYLSGASPDTCQSVFVACLCVTCLMGTLIYLIFNWAQIQGFGSENTAELESMSILINVKFFDMSFAIGLLTTMGAIIEGSMSVAVGMEQFSLTPKKPDQLFSFGISVGGKMFGTLANTVYFGFFGSSLALFIWFIRLNYGWGQLINDKIFVFELLLILFSFLAVVIIIPVTIVCVILQQRSINAHQSNR